MLIEPALNVGLAQLISEYDTENRPAQFKTTGRLSAQRLERLIQNTFRPLLARGGVIVSGGGLLFTPKVLGGPPLRM